MKRTATVVLFTLVCSVAAANEPVTASDGMPPEMPTPSVELDKLKFMLGNWDIQERHEAWPGMHDAFESKSQDIIVEGPGGFSVVSYYSGKSEMGPSVGHNTIYWDADENAYKSIWIDSWTPKPSFSTGKWEGDTLVFTGTVEMGGQSYSMKYQFQDITPKGFEMVFWMNDRQTMTMSYSPEKRPRSVRH